MGGTRALFASIGVSVALVAAATLSLFAVSVVIAFGGWSAGLSDSAAPPALVVGDGDTTQVRDARARVAAAKPMVLRAAQRARPRPAASAPARGARPRTRAVARRPVVTRRPVAAPAPPAAVRHPEAPARRPGTGDTVRRVRDDLSSKLRDTRDALGDATAPVTSPVGEAGQKVVDGVTDGLQRTTDRAGGTLDRLGR